MRTVDPTIVFFGAVGILYLVLIGVTLKKRGCREQMVALQLLYLGIAFLLTLIQGLSQLSYLDIPRLALLEGGIWSRAPLYGATLLALLFFHLSWAFLRYEGTPWVWWALGVVWAVAAVLLNEDILSLPEVLRSHSALGFGALVLGWGCWMGGATFLTARAHHRARQPLHRNRATCWSVPVVLAVAGAALLFAGRGAWGSGLYLLGAAGGVYLVLNYHLPDMRQMARRVVSYVIITLLTVLVYTAGFLAMQYVFQSVPGYGPLAVGAAMALVLAIVFRPLLRLIQRLVDRLVSGTRYDPNAMLREYSMSISNILDLERLAMAVVGLSSEAMGAGRGVLFVVHYERGDGGGGNGCSPNGYFRLRAVGSGQEAVSSGTLSFESPVADYLRLKQLPLTQYDVDVLPCFQGTAPDERAWLDKLDMDVYVPIYAKGEWIGLLALGPKATGDRYFDEDLTVLSTLADQTAVALENARLFDDLRVRNAENECLNKDLTVANRELARLDQAKSDFIDIASHELRTPLTQVSGYNDLLGAAIDDGSVTRESGLHLTQGVQKAALRLREIVNLMLDVSRLDTEMLGLDLSRTSVASVVHTAAEPWAEALEERQQTLVVEDLEDLPPITADHGRLKQVFSHLIQNAIKYTPDGGRIQITGRLIYNGQATPKPQHSSSETDEPPRFPSRTMERYVAVVVADTGIGIPTDDLERIFEKFYRVGDVLSHSSGKTKFKGAGPGLGLTIARGIVEAHGGSIWAESPRRDESACPGSEFYVVLPLKLGVEEAGRKTQLRAGSLQAEGGNSN